MRSLVETLRPAADCLHHRGQHREAVVERLVVAVGRGPVSLHNRIETHRIGAFGPRRIETPIGPERSNDADECAGNAVQREAAKERAGDGDIEGVPRVGQIEVIVHDEMSELCLHACTWEFDVSAGNVQLDVLLVSPVVVRLHERQQQSGR